MYTQSIRAIGDSLSRLSDAYSLGLPKVLVPLVRDFVYNFRDPRKYWDYRPSFNYGIDDLAEAAIQELECFNFSRQWSRMPTIVFQFLNVANLHDFEILPNEYYEIEYNKYYFYNTPENTPVGDFHRMYCKECIKLICDAYNFRLNVVKCYAVKTLYHDEALEEVADLDSNYCANCFLMPLYTLNECSGYDYIDIANHWAVPYTALSLP